MLEDTDLVAIAAFDNLSEAEVARSLLESEGIEVVIQDQPLASLLPPVALANGGLVLLVAQDEVERARDVLAAPDLAEVEGDADADDPEERLAEPEASGDGAVV